MPTRYIDVSDACMAEGLALYTKRHWSGVQFAEFCSITQPEAHMILSGAYGNHIPRPPGFRYPWPDAATMHKRVGENHGRSKGTEAQVIDVRERIARKELKRVRLPKETVDAILADMRAGMPQGEVIEKYDITRDKYYWYMKMLKEERRGI